MFIINKLDKFLNLKNQLLSYINKLSNEICKHHKSSKNNIDVDNNDYWDNYLNSDLSRLKGALFSYNDHFISTFKPVIDEISDDVVLNDIRNQAINEFDLLLNEMNFCSITLLNKDKEANYYSTIHQNIDKICEHISIISALLNKITYLKQNDYAAEYHRLKNLDDAFKNLDVKDVLTKATDIITNAANAKTTIPVLNEKLTNLDTLIKEDLNTIATAINAGKEDLSIRTLGESFSTRSTNLDKTSKYWLWGAIALIGIIIIFAVVTVYMNSSIEDNFDILNIRIRKLVFYVPVFLASFWGLWFCCKQYAYSCRLRDDYHYKYDLSTAFYGYNEEVKRLAGDDKTIQLALLDIVLKNIGKNPVDSKAIETDCNSPYTEGLKKFNELVSETNKLVTNLKSSSNDEKKKEEPKS